MDVNSRKPVNFNQIAFDALFRWFRAEIAKKLRWLLIEFSFLLHWKRFSLDELFFRDVCSLELARSAHANEKKQANLCLQPQSIERYCGQLFFAFFEIVAFDFDHLFASLNLAWRTSV